MVPRVFGSFCAVLILLIVASRQAAAMPALDQTGRVIGYRIE
jgi:hypothetical protein